MIQLPQTIDEAEALACARDTLAFFRNNKVDVFGIDVAFLDKDENRHFARHMLKGYALEHPVHMMTIADFARAGWDLADEALRELIIEFSDRDERIPTYLSAYNMEVARGGFKKPPGPKKSDTCLRDVVLCIIVERLVKRFGLRPTRNAASRKASACSIAADAVGMSEASIVGVWTRMGRHL